MEKKRIVMRRFIKGVLERIGYKIERINNVSTHVILNVFGTNCTKRVLISYIVDPFLSKVNYNHSNKLECFTAANIFNNLGFQVDVVDFFYAGYLDYEKYDVIYGFGLVFENSFYSSNSRLRRIYYGTGCCPFYSNIETTKKIISFYRHTGLLIPESGRLVKEPLSLSLFASDAIIALGNDFVLRTYKMYENAIKRFYSLNAFYFDIYKIDLEIKNFDIAKKHFIWFGSSGLLHKGLDILIDIFSSYNDITLHICGAPTFEKRFFEYYESKINRSDNIVNHGFVNIESDDFKYLMDLCAFVVFPSVSEGGAVSLLNVMSNGGLIPIITKSCGLDISDLGWEVEKLDRLDFEDVIRVAQNQDSVSLRSNARKVIQKIHSDYNYTYYKYNLQEIMYDIIGTN